MITGIGHHTAQASHQRKAEGGARASVEEYLRVHMMRTRADRSGRGAFLVNARGAR